MERSRNYTPFQTRLHDFIFLNTKKTQLHYGDVWVIGAITGVGFQNLWEIAISRKDVLLFRVPQSERDNVLPVLAELIEELNLQLGPMHVDRCMSRVYMIQRSRMANEVVEEYHGGQRFRLKIRKQHSR